MSPKAVARLGVAKSRDVGHCPGMGRIPTATKMKLSSLIGLLREVSTELEQSKPFFSKICRSLAEALTRSMEEGYEGGFVFDLPANTSTIIDSHVRADAPTCHFDGTGSVRISSR